MIHFMTTKKAQTESVYAYHNKYNEMGFQSDYCIQ